MGVLKSVREVVDEQILHDAGFPVFLLYIDVVAFNVAIEHSFGNVQLRRCLFGGYQQGPKLHLCLGGDDVLEVEGYAAEHHTEDDERTDNPDKRDAGCFHGKKLELFTEVSEGHQCSQKNGQWEGYRNQRYPGVEEELGHDRHLQTLAYQFIYISPEELHHEDEKADEECTRKE